ncbi:MFS general substrate transporter [Colletotrichum zoysiae]|uniref:MFS general substrate transporter n=1 Tax=Colletotrichum zoysiae TaxID=1216348 RepID=A0AAD9H9P1_9PEZI|nr:MFS general substrate transporter [Colletotrichum zoysiae]
MSLREKPEETIRQDVLAHVDNRPASSAFNTDLNSPVAGHIAPRRSLAFYLSFVAVLVNLFLYALDATTLSVATPPIAADLAGTSLESFWASISYLLAVTVTQPLYAALSDVLGRESCLYAAYMLFAVGSIVFGLAKTMSGVIAGRVLQGLGGGGLDVLSEIVVTDMTTLQERSLYLGLMAIPTALGSVLGPTMGGVFSSLVTWRWLGWINLPLLGISFSLTAVFLRLRPLEHSRISRLRTLDWVGMPVFTAGTVLFALPLSWAGNLYAWNSFRTLLPLLVGAALLCTFAFYESKPVVPVMPHRIFRSKTASATLAGVFLHGVSLYSLLQWLPLLYQAVMAKTVLQSAVSLLPTSVVSVVSAVAGVTVVGLANVGYRWCIRLSWTLTVVGTGVLVLLDADSPASMVQGLPVIWGAGIGLLLRLLFLPLQASVVRVDDTGLAIGILLTFRLFGGLVGLSICSTVFSSYFARAIRDIGALPSAAGHLRDTEAAVAFIPQLRTLDLSEDALLPIVQAYLTSIRAIMYTMMGFSGLGLLTSFFTSELSLQRTERGQQKFEG